MHLLAVMQYFLTFHAKIHTFILFHLNFAISYDFEGADINLFSLQV
jgi:hypothetical protein